MNLRNVDRFAAEAGICLRETISPFSRQELESPKTF